MLQSAHRDRMAAAGHLGAGRPGHAELLEQAVVAVVRHRRSEAALRRTRGDRSWLHTAVVGAVRAATEALAEGDAHGAFTHQRRAEDLAVRMVQADQQVAGLECAGPELASAAHQAQAAAAHSTARLRQQRRGAAGG